MRVLIAGLLIIGGGLAALALIWMFYTTSDPKSSSAISVVTDEETEKHRENTTKGQTDSTEGTSESAAKQSDREKQVDPDDTPSLKIDVVRIGPDGTAVFAGQGSANAGVVIFEKNKILAQTSVSVDGEWVAVAEQPLTAGEHLIIAEMKTSDGKIYRADQAVIVELGISGQDMPLIALVPMTEQSEAELIQTPNALAGTPQTQVGGQTAGTTDLNADLKAVLIEPVRLSVMTLSWADQDSLFIKGTSNGGEAVRGMLNDRVFIANHDKDSGDWTARISLRGLKGESGLLVSHLLNATNKVIVSHQLDFSLSQLDVGRDGSEMIIIEKGDMLWRIAYRTYGDGIRYLDIVKRNQDRIADPDLIYPAQIFALPE